MAIGIGRLLHMTSTAHIAGGIDACQLIGTLILCFVGICTPRDFDWPRVGLTAANVWWWRDVKLD
jgi:hypothetical protein